MKKSGKCETNLHLKTHLLRKIGAALFFAVLASIPLRGFAQGKGFTLELKQATVEAVFLYIEKNSDYSFVYNADEVQRIGRKDYKFRNAPIREVLDDCLKGSGLAYEIRDRHIIIRRDGRRQSVETVSVIGQVTGIDGKPLPGVTVILKGTGTGTSTDMNGKYHIPIPADGKAVLVFSFIGLKVEEVACKDLREINVVMEESAESMDEVVVTGYQTMRKSDVVGSIATVKASDIMMPAYTSIDQMLQGRVAGMVVTQTSSRVGTTPQIRIRGTSTILGNRDPLWVVDGVIQPDPIPMDQNDVMVDDLKNILGNQISWLNPSDIETITVLKDASATAIYGSKAANGVIVITTKRGQSEQLAINYSGTFSFRARPNYGQFDLMNSRERIQFSREAFAAGAVYTVAPDASMHTYEGIMRLLYDRQITEAEAQSAIRRLEEVNTDWFKLLTRNSLSQNHNLSLSGGNSKVLYNVSMNYSDQAGIEKKNDAKNMGARMNLSMTLHPKVRLDVSLNGSVNRTTGYAASVDPLGYATKTSRSIPAYDEGDRYFLPLRTKYDLNENHVFLGYNILNEMDHSYSKNKSSQIHGNVNFSWDALPWMRYEFVGGVNNSTGVSESYAGEQTYFIAAKYRGYDFESERFGSDRYKAAMLPNGGELYNGSSDVLGLNIQNKLMFNHSFNSDHRINAMLGMEASSTQTANRMQKILGYVKERGESIAKPTPISEIVPIGSGTVHGLGIFDELYNGTGWTRSTLKANQFSLFATLAYVYKNRYVLNASMRNDTSNRFGQDQNKRFDPTFSFGLSWNVALEPWMEGALSVLNQFNLRASYGIQGNTVNSISPELILTMDQIKPYYGEYMSKISRIPNPHLSWERTKTWNFGLDIQFIQWITMNLEYYTKRSNNIINQPIALEYGRAGTEINGGRIVNSGVEYTLNITPIRTKDWAWTIGLNSSRNWNKAKTQSTSDIYLQDYLAGSTDKVLKKGYDISSFWSFDFRGLNQLDGTPEFNRLFQRDEQGNIMKDENGNPLLLAVADYSDMLVYSGKMQPDFSGGLTTRLRWRNLTLGANFSLIVGGKKRLTNPYANEGNIPISSVNVSKELKKRWRNPGDEKTTGIPGVYSGRITNLWTLQDDRSYNMYNMWGLSNALVANSSFFRCQQISLTWNLNDPWNGRAGIKNLSVNAIVNNVFVIASKKFKGFDPELGNSVQPKIFSLGLTVGF